MEAHPAIGFREGPTGRRAVLAGGPEVADVIGSIVGGDVPVEQRLARASELLGLAPSMADAAMAYYADYTEEIDAQMTERRRVADEAEAAWMRQRALLEK